MSHFNQSIPKNAKRIDNSFYLAKEECFRYTALFHAPCNVAVWSGSILKVIATHCNNDISTDDLWNKMILNLYTYHRDMTYKCNKCKVVVDTQVLDIAERMGCIFR